MSVLWTSAQAQAATGGRTTCDWQASGVSIDTRTLEPGDLFVALKDQRDGHDFVAQALAAGAAAALVSRVPDGVPQGAPLLIVDDVLAALESLGRAARARFRGRLVAVTGSVGKTSTKEMLRSVLARQGSVHAAEKSFNNHWGVPVTLARMPPDADFAVIEIGMNHPGEIAPLARLARPHVAMITIVAAAHMEAFADIGGLAGIAREKADIFKGVSPGGTAVVNGDLDVTPILTEAANAAGLECVAFGAGDACDYHLARVQLVADTTVAKARLPEGEILFKLMSAGRHFATNAVGVLAAVSALGGDSILAARDLVLWQPPAGRGRRETLVLDPVEVELRIDLIDDSYNANPTSVAAALEALAAALPDDNVGRIAKGRRIAILGDMLELGPDEAALHAGLADLPAFDVIDTVHCVGPRMRHLWQALPEIRRGCWHEDAAAMAAQAHRLVDAGDVIMVKGSLGARVGLVVDAIRKLGHPVPNENERS